ncbi:hypothetical protein LCGC14_1313300 [marine sediment metagenome]|uniref:Uncharacterized protein n=1 Tax=marine sediment metagenome TaxID=412755 RepID=A0A0F9KM89_9ZZZZ
MTNPPGPGQPGFGQVLDLLRNLPSPDKLYIELLRLNNNMEALAPDLHKLAQATEGPMGADIRALAAALKGLDVGDLKRLLNEFNQLGGQIYERLWGKS